MVLLTTPFFSYTWSQSYITPIYTPTIYANARHVSVVPPAAERGMDLGTKRGSGQGILGDG